jgi:hypothetical protein
VDEEQQAQRRRLAAGTSSHMCRLD